MPGAPQHEVPGDAVPQADQHEGGNLGDKNDRRRRKLAPAGA